MKVRTTTPNQRKKPVASETHARPTLAVNTSNPASCDPPQNSFLIPQNSFLMLQNLFIMLQNSFFASKPIFNALKLISNAPKCVSNASKLVFEFKTKI